MSAELAWLVERALSEESAVARRSVSAELAALVGSALEEGEPGGAAGFVPVGATPATQAESDASGAVSELAPSPSSSPRPLDLACPMDVPRGVFCKVCGKRH